jgi:ankyrin repeat protein
MPLLNLPNELLQHIAECLVTEGDINAIAQANHRFHYLLDIYLYRHNVQESGSSALLWAILYGEEATVKKLLKEKADTQPKNDHDKAPLLFAVEKGRIPVVELLIDNGTKVNAESEDYGNALQAASDGGYK